MNASKYNLIVLLLFFVFTLDKICAQAPSFIPYQAILRDNAGVPISNQSIVLEFKITENDTAGALIFHESHNLSTNSHGLIQCHIGGGVVIGNSSFSQTNFGVGKKFLHVGVHLGQDYFDLGVEVLNSVPYAIFANNIPVSVSPSGDTLRIGRNNIIIPGVSAANAPVPVFGCTDEIACNYNPMANQDDQSCFYIGQNCNDGNSTTVYDIISVDCLCEGLPGSSSIFQSGNGVYDIDGNFYPTIVINGQEWMRKNLAVSKYRNGDAIPFIPDNTVWSNIVDGGYSVYNNQASLGKIYGKLYNWYVVEDFRGVCPTGWHVPSDQDWGRLINFLDPISNGGEMGVLGSGNSGGAMKTSGILSETGGEWLYPNFAGTDSSGFSGLPAGLRLKSNGNFAELGETTAWWTSTLVDYEPSRAYSIRLYNYSSSALKFAWWSRGEGLSIRCVMDEVQNSSLGCIDPTACNYSYLASEDDGSCKYMNNSCDDGLSQTTNDQISYYCQCQGYIDNSIVQQGQGVYDLDGNFYQSVVVGDQEWMQSNLAVTRFNNGDSIFNCYDSLNWSEINSSAFCRYENSQNIAQIYGNLYNGFTITDERNICPSGWHIPDNNEWEQLALFVGGFDKLDSQIKSTNRWVSSSSNNGLNFYAFPAGTRYLDGMFDGLYYNGFSGSFAGFWSSSDMYNGNSNVLLLSAYADMAHLTKVSPRRGFSVRCVKN
jgi:uncharacterized protein (TIGR02145 family)